MMTQENDTLHAEQKKNNEGVDQKSTVTAQLKERLENLKDSTVAKMTACVAAGMVAGVGVSYAASQIDTDEQSESVEQPEQSEGPTIEERLAALEEQELIRQQQEQERQQHEQERQHQEHVRQANEHKRHEPEPEPEPKPEKTFFDQHEVKIIGEEEVSINESLSVRMYYGVVDGYPAIFTADEGGHVVSLDIDINGDSNISEGETIDLTSEGITAHDLQAYVTERDEPITEPGSQPELIMVEHDVDFMGMSADVATVSDGNREVHLIDVDKDREVDFIAADLNRDGRVSFDEIADINDRHVIMPSEEDITGTSSASLDDDTNDYTNDGDITFYDA